MIVYIGFAQPDEWPQWAAAYAVHAQREDYTERFPDGRHILQAFFREAAQCIE